MKMLFKPNQKVLDPLSFYVFGACVSYSRSPAMHRVAYDFCGMAHEFHAMGCSTVGQIAGTMGGESFGGASLAAPFKAATMRILTAKSHHAAVIGAVNVLIPPSPRQL